MSSKPECMFGSSCFRRNPAHYQQYHHAHLAALAATPEQDWGPAASDQLRAQIRVHRIVEGEGPVLSAGLASSSSPEKRAGAGPGPMAAKEAGPGPVTGPGSGETSTTKVAVVVTTEATIPTMTAGAAAALAAERRLAGVTRDTAVSSRKRRRSEEGAGQNSGPEKKMKGEGRTLSRVEEKLEAAAPFNFFLTKVKELPDSHRALDRAGLEYRDLKH